MKECPIFKLQLVIFQSMECAQRSLHLILFSIRKIRQELGYRQISPIILLALEIRTKIMYIFLDTGFL